ncbi:hydrogenase maturation protein [Thiohalorhabdus sp.]|uniref:hydrogenase maturation protein n=1 Tax=Thiohalorhabdus sp. TaxID=3094134 RepID=UPI002FC2D4BF
MRIFFLTHAFNSLNQRLFAELTRQGHQISVELDINDDVTREAVALYQPELIIAPILKRAIPADIWRNHLCLIVHPGIKGDRGPSSLDWALLEGEQRWGVTVLQAEAEIDAGAIWASREFPVVSDRKASVYRNELTEAAVEAVLAAVSRAERGDRRPEPLDYSRDDVRGGWRPAMRQADRAIDWQRDDTATVLRKILSADSQPGVLDRIAGIQAFIYDAHPEEGLSGEPGELLARRGNAVCRATADGAVWIGHLRPEDPEGGHPFKLPAAHVLHQVAGELSESAMPFWKSEDRTYQDIAYDEADGVGFLSFGFYNGAMGVAECERLLAAYRRALQRDTRVLVLLGGRDFWSNGIHLNRIEAANSPADEAWANIQAMNDLVRAILTTDDRLTVAAMRGNAGAGGVFLGLAADHVVARSGVVLNPHYKNMGNLYGSEYWTFSLPRKVGEATGRAVMAHRLPLLADEALEIGLVDELVGHSPEDTGAEVTRRAKEWAASEALPDCLTRKRQVLAEAEAEKPLDQYRSEELEGLRLNFYGFDPSFHVARYNFVHKVASSRTPLYLASHRRLRRQGANQKAGSIAQAG